MSLGEQGHLQNGRLGESGRYVILSCSLRESSRSRILAEMAAAILTASGRTSNVVDLRFCQIPQFDDDSVYLHPNFEILYKAINEADGVVIASPVFNWQLSSIAKNAIESTGATDRNGRQSAWFDKVVTFLCAGGLPQSYMAYGGLALSLMADFKCVINPYAVYSSSSDWTEFGSPSQTLSDRLLKTIQVKIELVEKLKSRSYSSIWEI